MTTDAKIQPALSAEEWADLFTDPYDDSVPDERIMGVACSDRMPTAHVFDGTLYLNAIADHDTDLPQLMAVANAALPDDSPHKITRADVARLEGFANWIREELHYNEGAVADTVRLSDLAAKLAALLPPE